ncbi:curli assembly protein CsgF [Rhodopseudomonas sp. AAP120]|jgi:curli production assembly/transport component CsgF|uniref:curli assembly protein CsgF n=1 Tax=unclassified Rhodopseudomonas TaxID=2638247 RepID=UPI0006B8A807|nr:curli assembly protein CsgF [Rhodopseudomonas sp. AAP120]KPF97218.1 curli assembly protein CsgF [Rhodopseudomonas sp. AAP120]
MRIAGLLSLCVGVALSGSAFATEQVYRPISPTLGGNPLAGNFLLSMAQAQGKGATSGNKGVDLSGLSNALSNVGGGSTSPVIVIGGSGVTTPTSP